MLRYLENEKGSQTIEFIGVLPVFLLMMIIIWQTTLAAKTKLEVEAAAMEGARAAVVNGDYETAAKRVISNYGGISVVRSESGNFVTVRVTVNMPLLDNNTVFNTDTMTLPVSAETTMRKED